MDVPTQHRLRLRRGNNNIMKIFNPEGIEIGKYRKAYPELDSITEFEQLKEDELMIAWWFACESSPLKSEGQDRMNESAYKVYKDNEIAIAYAQDFVDGTLPNQELMLEAIDRMYKMSPSAREKANGMVCNMFDQYEVLLQKPLTYFTKADGTLDSAAYSRVRQIIRSELPKLIEQIEMGFGTHKNKEIKEREGHQNIDTFLKNKESGGVNHDNLD
jgi:hypothetical protein